MPIGVKATRFILPLHPVLCAQAFPTYGTLSDVRSIVLQPPISRRISAFISGSRLLQFPPSHLCPPGSRLRFISEVLSARVFFFPFDEEKASARESSCLDAVFSFFLLLRLCDSSLFPSGLLSLWSALFPSRLSIRPP